MSPSEPIDVERDERDPGADRDARVIWCELAASSVAKAMGVDPDVGLGETDVVASRSAHGTNRLAEPERPSKIKMFLDKFRSGIVYVLAAAGVLAGLLGDLKDLIIIFVVLLINAVLGYFQEAKATDALAALERMLVTVVRVRRAGSIVEIPIDDVVPGDIVLLEAGDRVPADGRLARAVNLAVDESTLTGESVPVDKDASAVTPAGAPIGDRRGMVFMNTTVARGRAEVIVTDTGMSTEMGRIAEMLLDDTPSKTPLEVQLDRLGRRLAIIAGLAAFAVFVIQWIIEDDFQVAVLGAVALAVAAIPEGLPAVVTVTLAVGISKMASENAIVKRLHSVETLGSTMVICSDKTGTLTFNQMTAREVAHDGARWSITGEGYRPVGSITGDDGSAVVDATDLLRPAVLCADAVLVDGPDGAGMIGDPTEAALVVLAAKAGLDVEAERRIRPRLAEIPFDSATKIMATFHRLDPDDPDRILVCVKGAPDVIIGRSISEVSTDGRVVALDDTLRHTRLADNDRIAAQGMRVLAIATREIAASELFGADGTADDLDRWVAELHLGPLVGIVDPARPEAGAAIAECHRAGIDVKMITGDHAITAGVIARELGIDGEVVTGDDLDAMDDDELRRRILSVGVCARVSPEHKVRVVEALQADGRLVAMTGDGVNDAAALRRSDIGVAMGITGTEVTKEAGDMVLADDNFATIVRAVERGRVVFANILKFIRFQLATSFGAIGTILGASVAAVHVPFTPLQVLWVNLIADGPTAIALGVDDPDPGVMDHSPRARDAAILDRARLAAAIFQGLVTTVGVLAVYLWAIAEYSAPDAARAAENTTAMTMAFTAFVLAQLVNVFSSRSETRSVFTRYTFTNGMLWASVGAVVVLQCLVTYVGPLRTLFDTEALDIGQWVICVLPAVGLLGSVEIWKVFVRRNRSRLAGSVTVT